MQLIVKAASAAFFMFTCAGIWLFLLPMNHFRRSHAFAILLVTLFGLFSSCKQDEQTSWDIEVLAPLAETRLSVHDLIADSLIISEPGEPVVIRFSSTYNLVPNDSLFQIPDTTFNSSFSLPVNVNLPAGFQVLNISQIVRFSYKDAQLTEAVIASGSASFEVLSTMNDKVYFDYGIPLASKNGNALILNNQEINSGSIQTPSTVQQSIDLSGYFLDLRGDNGNLSNQIRVNLNSTLNPAGNGTAALANQPLFSYVNRFRDIRPYYGRGFLGSSSFSGDDFLSLSDLRKLEGIIRLQDIHLDLEVENSIGADFSLNIINVTASRNGINLALTHPIVGSTQQYSRAQHIALGDLPYTPTVKSYSFNTVNSNLKELIELLPDRLSYAATAQLNPLGNVSSGNDFFYNSSNLRIRAELELPLSFSANALSFTDTLTTAGIASSETELYRAGALRLLATNGFPFDLQVKGYLLNENKVLIDSLLSTQTIAAATVNAALRVEQPSHTVLNIPVSESLKMHLDQARYIVLKARLNTQPEDTILPMYADYELHLQLIGDGTYRVKVK